MKKLHFFTRLGLKATHCPAIKLGSISNLCIANNLISLYAKCSDLSSTHQLFDEMPHRDTVSWNAIISAYVNSGHLGTTWKIVSAMRWSALAFDNHALGSILKGVALAGELKLGQQMHSVMLKTGLVENMFSGSALLDMYAKCGRIDDAYIVFKSMPERNYVSWNTLVAGYSRVGVRDMAFQVLHCMELEGVEIDDGMVSPLLTLLDDAEFLFSECCPLQDVERVFDGALACHDVVTWNSMLGAYLMHEKEDFAFKVFIDMQNFGFEPDAYTYVGSVSACSAQERKSNGKCVHGFNDMGMEDALRIFFSTNLKDGCTWNSILAGYVQGSLTEDALRIFLQMRSLVIEINHYTFSAVIRSCSDLATLQLGQQVHVLAFKVGLVTNNYVGSSFIIMYSKCGIIEDARKSFEATSKDYAIVWNSVIFRYAQHGQGNLALDLFYSMNERKVKPDHITFVAVLTACSHNGLVEEGCNIIESMESDFGIPQPKEHYACAIDLYGRAGQLEKAKALVETMPFEAVRELTKTFLFIHKRE
ncbi:putative pentatricopeptide repeat-containing protein At3g25970 [Vigna angularis]|uniref:putative pentatricopeptide repeat-containing protein At3g25970 n=1 Tax=Phaseolus angularis TaxID=3914 RepID=UPI0022B2DA4F|nr:putative pentatricopeptide repeat-containing protein At3g25970 [Vigna angularis]